MLAVMDAGRQQAKVTQEEYSGLPLLAAVQLAASIVLLFYGGCSLLFQRQIRDPPLQLTGVTLLHQPDSSVVHANLHLKCVQAAFIATCSLLVLMPLYITKPDLPSAGSLQLSGDLKPISMVNPARCWMPALLLTF